MHDFQISEDCITILLGACALHITVEVGTVGSETDGLRPGLQLDSIGGPARRHVTGAWDILDFQFDSWFLKFFYHGAGHLVTATFAQWPI